LSLFEQIIFQKKAEGGDRVVRSRFASAAAPPTSVG
jgi:hypothetical protein